MRSSRIGSLTPTFCRSPRDRQNLERADFGQSAQLHHGPTTTPCGKCDNCQEIAAGNSLDVLEIDGASNNGVEQVRELRDNVRYAPAKGRLQNLHHRRSAHADFGRRSMRCSRRSKSRPTHVKFIFATTEPQKVLPTILSRCQRFDLHRIPAN